MSPSLLPPGIVVSSAPKTRTCCRTTVASHSRPTLGISLSPLPAVAPTSSSTPCSPLVADAPAPDRFQGGWELDESVEEAASRESLEEAGVIGNVERQLGKWDFLSKSRGTFYEGLMFPMLVKEELELWPEQHLRQRMWMKVDEAREACRDWWMKEALDALVDRLSSSPSMKPMEEDTKIQLISTC
ncbi:hypothetical protein DY000_02045350 [Brassica cretica]|uniref:Nudix hydrolase domain-containing protein n=1 Tax=Brassica cretica TaxID=69181 RepID=A0ABQ7ETP2_BRACR|nr:hypothetical protein DY000_02045350 [Brassica cretica]